MQCQREVCFKQCLFQVRLVQVLYSEPVLRKAVIKSLKGTAVDLVRYMQPEVEVEGIISNLETVYGIAASFNVLMQSFYKINQVQSGKIRAFNQIRLKYSDQIVQLW